MKIAFLHHVFQTGSGIEQVILDLSRQLVGMGHRVTILTYKNEYPDCDVCVMEFPLRSRVPLAQNVLAPVFTRTNAAIRDILGCVDVVVSSLYPMSLVPLLPNKVRPRVVFIEWGIQPYAAYSSLVDKAYLFLLSRADRYAIQKSDTVIVSNEVTRKWVEGLGVSPVKMNLYGLNFDRLRLGVDYDYLWDKHPVLQGADGIVMYAGRQSPHKNIDLLIRAMGILRDRGLGTRLLVVGKESFPKYAGYLRSLTRELGLEDRVVFTGLVSEEDLCGYYNLCDLFVNASSWEGYLNPEAFAFKKPIVAYGIPPHDETVEDGITGVLVGRLTANRFADGIAGLLTDEGKRKALGLRGYVWAKRELDYAVVADRFLAAISQ
ncbi:MAG: glycosyltransferase family 4 protein [Candidatus Bathyanammoxibius sp.]